MIDTILKAARGTLLYGYFVPITAAWLAIRRPGSYIWRLRALYKLAFWSGSGENGN